MEKSKPLELGLDLLKNYGIVENNECRFINHEIGVVLSFANMQSKILKVGQPYRLKEGRLLYVLKGTARILINLIEYTVSMHTIVVLPPNSIVELMEVNDNYDFRGVAFTNDFLPTNEKENLTDSYQKQGFTLHLTEKEWRLEEAYFSILWAVVNEVPFRREVVQHTLTAMLFNLRYLQDKNYGNAPSGSLRNEELFRRFINLVNENCKKERNVSFYADKLCLTPKYLGTIIRQITQQTVMDWIEQAVILEAKVLLKHSDLLIYQISDELNFPNPSFFSKFFKRLTGMTPLEYQKAV